MRKQTAIGRAAILAVCLMAPRSAVAQQQGWHVKPTVRVSSEYDDNVFLRDPDAKARIGEGASATRYAGMDGAGDLIGILRAEIAVEGRGIGNRALSIVTELGYDHYMVNTDRSLPHFGVTVSQNLPSGSRLRVRADASPSTFFKNYLAGAIDANLDGSIASSERIYARGAYAEQELVADYRFRLKRARETSPLATYVQMGAGYYRRSYEAPFARRDQTGPEASVGLLLEHGRGELRVRYDLASLGATPGQAVLLLDEPNFRVDFNGNGTVTDLDARAVQMVDHSRIEHAISLAGAVPAGQRAVLHLDYELRRRSFGSTQPYDVAHNGRQDARHSIGAGLAVDVARTLQFIVAGEIQRQSVNKPLDASGEVTDYSRNRLSAGLRYTY